MLNLYLLSQDTNRGHDTYDSCVVAAETEKDAKHISPCSSPWGYTYSGWCSSPDDVTATFIGTAIKDVTRGIMISSFNAG